MTVITIESHVAVSESGPNMLDLACGRLGWVREGADVQLYARAPRRGPRGVSLHKSGAVRSLREVHAGLRSGPRAWESTVRASFRDSWRPPPGPQIPRARWPKD